MVLIFLAVEMSVARSASRRHVTPNAGQIPNARVFLIQVSNTTAPVFLATFHPQITERTAQATVVKLAMEVAPKSVFTMDLLLRTAHAIRVMLLILTMSLAQSPQQLRCPLVPVRYLRLQLHI